MCQSVLKVKDASPFHSVLYSKAIQDPVQKFDFTETNTRVTVQMLYEWIQYKKGQFLVTGGTDSVEFGEFGDIDRSDTLSQIDSRQTEAEISRTPQFLTWK